MKTILSLIALMALLSSPPPATASDQDITTMAQIVMHLQHYPTEAEKKQLAAMTRDASASEGERTLAGALMRMRHRVEGRDADRLHALLKDSHAGKDEQKLARILLAIVHHPDAAQKKELSKLINGK